MVDTKVYSNRETKFVSQEEIKLYHKDSLENSGYTKQRSEIISELIETDNYINLFTVTKEQLQKTSLAFKEEQEKVEITHILDSGFDNENLFNYIDKELKDKFVIRLKLSRNSNEIYLDENSKEKHVKIKTVKLANKKRFPVTKVKIKNKIYQNASCLIEYDKIIFDKQKYIVVRVMLNDTKGEKIFKEPMLLLTNRHVKTATQAHGIYFAYLQRSKIEGVFKFLKDVLG